MKRNYTQRHIRRLVQAATNADLKEILHLSHNQLDENQSEDSLSMVDDELLTFPTPDSHWNVLSPIDSHDPFNANYEVVTPNIVCSFAENTNTLPNNNINNNVEIKSDNESIESNNDNISSDNENTFSRSLNNYSLNYSSNNYENGSNNGKKFEHAVASWAIEHNVPHKTCNSILSILRKFTSHIFPKDVRTLLRTPRETNVLLIGGGSYCHFGLRTILEEMLVNYNDVQNLNLLINIDGLPITKSSTACLWPILCSNSAKTKVYIVGAFYGFCKPSCANEFLKPLVNDLITFISNGIHTNRLHVQVRLHALICDTPAKSFVLATKAHTGYYSCSKCTIEGMYKDNRLCFANRTANTRLRTDEEFSQNQYDDYQTGYSIFTSIPHFGGITNVPLDYMHLICLGVVKKLILLWLKNGPLSVRIRGQSIDEVSRLLLSLRNTAPKEFSRKPRGLEDVRHWKATEFRTFLLYTSPVVLMNILEKDAYLHFLTLHVAIFILASPVFSKDRNYIDYAEALLEHFVESFAKLYGAKNISHNVHNLLHLCSDVKKYGALDSFSAFRFENYLFSIKKLLRKAEKPLEQLVRRYYEIESVESNFVKTSRSNSSKFIFQNAHSDGPVINIPNVQLQFKIMSNSFFVINCDSLHDKYCILKTGQCVHIKNIVKANNNVMYIVGNILNAEDSLYSTPCESNEFEIQLVSADTRGLQFWPVTLIKYKAWKMSCNHRNIVFPIIHTE